MQLRDRFILDPEANILCINFAGLRIESRGQVDEMSRLVREAFEQQGRRLYAIANYEGTELAPEIIDYYGERIKELHDRYGLTTVRYSSSGFTRSVLRYLGAAKDLESNTFATREAAIRAIQEMKDRSQAESRDPAWLRLSPRRSLLGKLALGWLLALTPFLGLYLWALAWAAKPEQLRMVQAAVGAAALSLLVAALITGAVVLLTVVRPLRQMEGLARRLVAGGVIEPIKAAGRDEVGRLAQTLDEAARHLQQEIERLSGLYHISLMMGTGTEVSRICELLTRKIARLLGAEMCVILLYDEREKRIYAQLPAHGVSDEQLLLLRAGLEQQSIAAWVFKTGEPYLTNEAARDPLISRAAAEMLGVREMLAVPLQAGERTLGTLEVMNKPGGFFEEDRRLVTIFASQAAHLLANAQLFEQVRGSEERYRQIFESALDGLYRSTPAGDLVTVNPALAAMLGYSEPEELIGANLTRDLLTDRSAGTRMMEELAECGQVLDLECELRRQSGETMPARLSIRAITDKADQRVYHLGIIKDITEQKRLSQQLIVSERLAVVGELVAGVAHEVRNPLFGITTTLSALARRLEDREAVRPFLEVVMTEVDRLNHLMEQLLEHSRPAQLDGGMIDIRSVIDEALGEFRSQANVKGVGLVLECPEAMPSLHLDRRKMYGVFINLLDNALRHTGPGGQVQVAVSAPNGNSAGGGRQEIEIKVSDTGTGIAADDLQKIFDPFFTTRTNGTGLGLAIVRKTVHDHGGTIAVRSVAGQGATFIINLPLGKR